MGRTILLYVSFLFLLISCNNSQVNPLIGDYKSSCDPSKADCKQTSNVSMPAFERNDNSDIILSKLDNLLELSGNCDIKLSTDSEIQITIIPQGAASTNLSTGFMPIIGISTSGGTQQRPIAKCEKGKWALALNSCGNGLQNAGVHRVDLLLQGIDGSGRKVPIPDGTISAVINRTEPCL